jgi:hypothetical protein
MTEKRLNRIRTIARRLINAALHAGEEETRAWNCWNRRDDKLGEANYIAKRTARQNAWARAERWGNRHPESTAAFVTIE